MFKRFIFYFAFMIVLSAILISIRHQTGNLMIVETARTELTHFAKPGILLVPLDSRPPCTQFVAQLAAIGGKPVLMPPSEYLDHYKTPAKQKQVREWFLEHAKSSDTAIVSVDMLIHGGLLASRLSAGSEVDAQAVVDLLRKVKQDNPALKLYVFSIIPRLLLADTDEYYTHQKNVFNYSVRKDLLLTFENPIDYFKLRELEAQIPSLVIERYNSLYIKNKQFSYTLIGLAQEGIIDGACGWV